MSYTLAPIALTENVTSYVTLPGSGQSVAYIKLTNASPYIVLLSNLVNGQDYLQPGECNVWQVDGLSTAIQATPQGFLATPVSVPVSSLVATWFLAGEPAPSGNYPVNFNLLQYLGNTVMANSATDTMEQDLFTPFVLSGFSASKDGSVANQMNVTSGIAYPKQSDGSLLRTALTSSTFLTSTPSATYFLDLNPDGSWSWGTSHSTQSNYLAIAQATTDGSGNIVTAGQIYTSSMIHLLAGTGQTLNYAASVLLGSSLYLGATTVAGASQFLSSQSVTDYITVQSGASPNKHQFFTWDGVTQQSPLSLGDTGGAAYIDNAGVLHATAPVTLAAGHQETAQCGGSFTATAAAQRFSYVVPFKSRMTNTPTSITLSPTSTANFASVSASQITQDGFLLLFTSTAAGICTWIGAYTTVGN